MCICTCVCTCVCIHVHTYLCRCVLCVCVFLLLAGLLSSSLGMTKDEFDKLMQHSEIPHGDT